MNLVYIDKGRRNGMPSKRVEVIKALADWIIRKVSENELATS